MQTEQTSEVARYVPPSRSFRMRVVVVVAPCRPHLAVNHRHADRPHGRTPPSRNQVHVKSHCMKVSSSVFGCCARIRNSTGTETEDHIKTRRRAVQLLATFGASLSATWYSLDVCHYSRGFFASSSPSKQLVLSINFLSWDGGWVRKLPRLQHLRF